MDSPRTARHCSSRFGNHWFKTPKAHFSKIPLFYFFFWESPPTTLTLTLLNLQHVWFPTKYLTLVFLKKTSDEQLILKAIILQNHLAFFKAQIENYHKTKVKKK